jgi:hypothetical protein
MVKGDGELPEGMLDLEQYRMVEGETPAGLLEQCAAAAQGSEESVAALPDLDRSVPLPRTPWSPPETVHWSARRILLHLIRETAQRLCAPPAAAGGWDRVEAAPCPGRGRVRWRWWGWGWFGA